MYLGIRFYGVEESLTAFFEYNGFYHHNSKSINCTNMY